MLTLKRAKPPNEGMWNGLGGKIEPGETPEAAVRREIFEEAGLDVAQANALRFVGVVTWSGTIDPNNNKKGMYAFVAEFPEQVVEIASRETREGTLAWKPTSWLLDHTNGDVCENIPYFLPRMLSVRAPVRYHCVYRAGFLQEFSILPLGGVNIQV